MFEVKGIIAAMTTPMFEDGSINEQELRNQVERFTASNIHALFCLGTNGEFYALSFEEKIRVMEIVIEQNKGRLPIYAGTGCTSTSETIKLTQIAKNLGADCVSLISPYYAQCSQDMIYNHFKDVADAVDIPIILYNMPARTGNNIDYPTVAKLSKHPNIYGVKDSSGNFDNMLRYIEATDPSEFAVLSGNDSLILWNLLAGGKGGIAGISNILPDVLASIYDLFVAGDLNEARRVQDSIRPIRDCLKYGNPNSIIKRAVNLLGHPVGPARAPFHIQSEVIDKAILEALKHFE